MTEPEPATKGIRKAVVLCADQQFLPYALFLANQLHQKEDERDYDICIISDTPLAIPDYFQRLQLVVPDPISDANYNTLRTTHLARSAYLRMWAPHVLAHLYDRLIYLDSDMFVDLGGLSELFEIDMHDKPVAAVRDVQQWYRPNKSSREFSLSGQCVGKYFNSGFLLIDTERYISRKVLERAVQIGTTHPNWVIHHDQSLLNLALDGDWAELSPVWNWQIPAKYPLFTDWSGARILHFFGNQKPWNDMTGNCPDRIRLSYDAFMIRHFPQLAQKTRATDILRSYRKMAWMALRFLFMRPRILRYLDRFPNIYEAK